MAKDPQDDDDLKLCSHTMMLPTRGQLEGRMIVTAYEHGLDNVTEEAVSAVVYAVEVSLLVTETILQVGCNELVCVLKVGTARKEPKCRHLGVVILKLFSLEEGNIPWSKQLPSVISLSSSERLIRA